MNTAALVKQNNHTVPCPLGTSSSDITPKVSHLGRLLHPRVPHHRVGQQGGALCNFKYKPSCRIRHQEGRGWRFIEFGMVEMEEIVELLLMQGVHGSGRSKGIRERVRGGGAEDLVELLLGYLDVNPVQRKGWVLAELLRKALGFHESG